jgi:hypothetical protein
MALEPALRRTVEWIAQAFREYAADHNWDRRGYRILVRVNPDWGRVHVILAAKEFPGGSPQEQWSSVMDYLAEKFKDSDPQLTNSVSLTLMSFDEIEQGGIYALSPQFVDVDDLLDVRSSEPSSGTAAPLNIG